MSYGYTCNWCSRFAKPHSTGDVREPSTIPRGWATIKFGEHVCYACLDKGRGLNKPKPKPACGHYNKQYGPARGGAPSPYQCLDCKEWFNG
jgi:hypothetical protein